MRKLATLLALAFICSLSSAAIANDPPKHEPEKEKGKPDEKHDKPKEEAPPPPNNTLPISIGDYYDVPDITVNTKTYGQKSTFLKISLSLQMGKESDRKALDLIMPQVVDGIQNYLRERLLQKCGME